MTAERFSLDTDILVYAVDRTAGDKHARAVDLIYAAAAVDCILTVQCLAEFFHVVTRKRAMPAKAAAALVEDWRIQFPVVAADGPVLGAAMAQAAAGRLAFWDALLLETARAAGCRFLLSEDFQNGRNYRGVVVLNPLLEGPSPRLSRLLGA